MHSDTRRTAEPSKPIPLNAVERLFWDSEENLANAFRVSIVVRLEGIVDERCLSVALTHLQHRHPRLRARFSPGRAGEVGFDFNANSPIPFGIKDCEGELPWREEARRLLEARFPAEGPLVAVSVLRSLSGHCSALLLAAHHAICDGVSALTLMHDLLDGYARAESNPNLPLGPSLPVVTARRAQHPGGWRSRLWLVRRLLRIQRDERRSPQTLLPECNSIPPQSQWCHWIYSREDTLQLIQRCRKERVSIGAVTLASVCCGLADCLPALDTRFKCQFPFDLRGKLEVPARALTTEDVGCFVSLIQMFCEVPRAYGFWEVARRLDGDLQEFVRNDGPAFYYNNVGKTWRLVKFAAVVERVFPRLAPKRVDSRPNKTTVFATNYGVINMREAYGGLRPKGCTLTFKGTSYGPSLILETLVLSRQLNIGFLADELEPEFWDQLQSAVRRHLDAAAQPA